MPGIAHAMVSTDGRIVAANPLLDAWVELGEGGGGLVVKVPASDDVRDNDVRVGEALFYTSLMAPFNRSDGPLSRFTCETCHFEGYVDGRTHHTGRGDVRATTKPLVGLFGNRPHFSRALDPDLTTVAFNEFQVAAARSGHSPWFAVDVERTSWLRAMGVGSRRLSPLDLRRALMSYFIAASHRENPAAMGRAELDARERAGLRAFTRYCESCHAARLAAHDPATRVPEERWESMLLSPEAPIVWGRAGYEQTGVIPYVHRDGARVPSLRRLYKKRPYFTNGSASTVVDVIARVRLCGNRLWHGQAPAECAPLEAVEQDALAAFLDLL